MELQPFVCSCGRAFTVNFALSNHQNNCKQSKKRIAGALDSAQAAWRARKKRKTNGDSSTEIYSFAGLSVSVPDPTFMQVSLLCTMLCATMSNNVITHYQ